MLEEKIDFLSDLLKAISHPLRLRILCLLQDGEMSVGDIREKVQTSNANVSQHLHILRNQDIIESTKKANFIYNRIKDKRVVKLINTLRDLFC